jgi:G3E family GTPase
MDIPVTLLSGYLGAGKTTLINHVLTTAHGVRVTVLVNDFGAINIDASLIAARADETITLSNGCVCCSIQDDLGAAIGEQIRRERPPQHIIIEASGVAEPARILRYVESWPGLRLDAVVCVVDAETIRPRANDKFVGRVVSRQIAAADLLIVNKTDLVDRETAKDVADWLSTLAAGAAIVTSLQGRVDPVLFFGGGSTGGAVRDVETGDASPARFFNVTIPLPEPIHVDDLARMLEFTPQSVHRVKGFITDMASGQRMLVQCVGSRRSIEPWLDEIVQKDALLAIGTDRSELLTFQAQITTLAGQRNTQVYEPIGTGTNRLARAAAVSGDIFRA